MEEELGREARLLGVGEEWVEGAVDYKGFPVKRSTSGGWTSAFFIIGVEMAERLAYYGIASNLITYLTGPLHQSTADAAANVNIWSGASSLLPLLGAFVADSYLGRYRTILFASLFYILGLGLLTLSVTLPSLRPPHCEIGSSTQTSSCPSAKRYQILFFFFSLYIVAFGQGGHKPCVQAFGADQFDPRDPQECKSKSSFFNWWYFGLCASTLLSVSIVNYIQDNLSWALGFGIPCISMVVALIVFLIGTKTYRHCIKEENNPIVSVVRVFIAAIYNCRARSSTSHENSVPQMLHGNYTQFKFLDRAAHDNLNLMENQRVCGMNLVEDAKMVLRLVPIWATCFIYAVVFAQSSTLFTKQGSTMERSIGSGFQIPPSALQSFISFSIVAVIPIYDRVFVPMIRAFTGLPSGITLLQRIGIGIFLSVVSMVVAALVEAERLVVAQEAGLIDRPAETVPMSVWWLIPQYILFGVADVFTMVGLQEFFYDQVPDAMRSVGLSLYLSIFGMGSFISGFLISVIDRVTGRGGGESWFSNNLNRAHLDYFYWLLAVLSSIQLGIYLYFAKSFWYKRISHFSCI